MILFLLNFEEAAVWQPPPFGAPIPEVNVFIQVLTISMSVLPFPLLNSVSETVDLFSYQYWNNTLIYSRNLSYPVFLTCKWNYVLGSVN